MPCSIWRFDAVIWHSWCDLITDLLPRLCISLIIALIAIRFQWFRRILQRTESDGLSRLVMIVVFGLFSVAGTHSGDLIDPDKEWGAVSHSVFEIVSLQPQQIIVGFRDTWALIAGLAGGLVVGLGVGILAALDRVAFGGNWGLGSAGASLLLGVFAGGVRQFYPRWTNNAWRVLAVAVMGTILQRIVLLFTANDICQAWTLAIRIGVPVAIVNIAGCVLFVWIMQDLERDRLENDAREARLLVLQTQVERDRQGQLVQQAELRALRAQIDPHFLNNTLNDLKTLIRIAPDNARLYVSELADFFKNTLKFSGQNTVSLQQELEQVQRYLALQRLGYGDRLQAHIAIPEHLMELKVLPFCLITLVENALKYAFIGRTPPYQIHICAEEAGVELILAVRDNGRGISAERLTELGKAPVQSANKGSGVALYQLTQSLALGFGTTATLQIESIESGDNTGTLVRLLLPKRSLV
jgi:LytS/YehU family sensor histidine kinase